MVPKVGRWLGSEKRRGRGGGAGAEDGQAWREMVRSDAANRQAVGERLCGEWWDCLGEDGGTVSGAAMGSGPAPVPMVRDMVLLAQTGSATAG